MGALLIYYEGAGLFVYMDNAKHVKLPLMIGVHHIASLRGQLIQTEALCMYESIAHGLIHHVPSYGVSVLLGKLIRMLLYVYETKKIINYKRE